MDRMRIWMWPAMNGSRTRVIERDEFKVCVLGFWTSLEFLIPWFVARYLGSIHHGLTVSSPHHPMYKLTPPSTEAFTLAVTSIEENTPFTPNRQQLNTQYALSLYGLHQQATKGDYAGEGVVPERRKGVGLFPGKALVAAWASRRGITREEAMVCFLVLS